jgi:hypothetical protein
VIRFQLPWKWVRNDAAGEAPATKETTKRVVTKDQKREGMVLGRTAKWRSIRTEQRHLDAIRAIGPTSEFGQMTVEEKRREGTL